MIVLEETAYRVVDRDDGHFVGYFLRQKDAEKVPNSEIDKEEKLVIKIYETYEQFVEDNLTVKVETLIKDLTYRELDLLQAILIKRKRDQVMDNDD